MGIKEKLSGIFPPLMTPFLNDEEVAYDKLKENVLKYNETELKGYMPLGSNGEFRSLTEEESLKILDVVVKSKSKDKTLMAGTARESAKATIEFTKKAADKGIDFASILTPHYFAKKMTDEALIKHFIKIADNSPVPILLYNAPKFAAGVLISINALKELAQHPNIVGMKDTSKEDITEYIKAVPKGTEFYVMAGTISKFYTALKNGSIGAVLSMANYLPELCCKLRKLYMEGKIEESKKFNDRLCNLNKKISGKTGVAGVKGAMDLLGYYGGYPRIPLIGLNEEQKRELRINLKKEGLI